ncbi:hypothetical protein SMICM304S_08412 [Streptomyces microflavus]
MTGALNASETPQFNPVSVPLGGAEGEGGRRP